MIQQNEGPRTIRSSHSSTTKINRLLLGYRTVFLVACGALGACSGSQSDTNDDGAEAAIDEAALLKDLDAAEQKELCLSIAGTEKAIAQRCGIKAMLQARLGPESEFPSQCDLLAAACVDSRDDGSIDTDCSVDVQYKDSCTLTVGGYLDCVQPEGSNDQILGCETPYQQAVDYVVPTQPLLPAACDPLLDCYGQN